MPNDEFASLTEIGKLYKVSSHVVGRWLKEVGLRTDAGKPSLPAFEGEFVSQRPSRGEETYFYVWHLGKITSILDRQHERASD